MAPTTSGPNGIDSEGSRVWDDGSSPTHTHWCGGEPNNSHGHECTSATEGDCALLNWQNWGCWNDYPCECAIHYVCESS